MASHQHDHDGFLIQALGMGYVTSLGCLILVEVSLLWLGMGTSVPTRQKALHLTTDLDTEGL